MATPRCVKCEGTRFEANSIEPAKSRFRLVAINCASCGSVLSVIEAYNVSNEVRDIKQHLGMRL